MNDEQLEQRINELRLNAPRVTLDHIQSLVIGTTFTRLPSLKKLVCELTLANGFTVTGEASVVSVANFNQEIGERVSKDNAMQKIWPLEGYLLQQRLYQRAKALSEFSAAGRNFEYETVSFQDDTPKVRYEADDAAATVNLSGNFSAQDLRYFLAHLEITEEKRLAGLNT